MKRTSITLISIFIGLLSCKQNKKEQDYTKETAFIEVIKKDYELYKPNDKIEAVLILFGGYPEVAEDIKREFKILEEAKKKNIAVVFSNYNKKLWLEENEFEELSRHLKKVFTDNNLPNENIYFGGFSSGGDVALLIGNYLVGNREIDLAPKGIFIIDSPIDLAELYFSAEKNIEHNFSEVSVNEGTWLIKKLRNRFGNPAQDISQYEEYSVFTLRTGKTDNLKNLMNTKIRMYTEPDILWWKENRMAEYEQTNAYMIKILSEKLSSSGFTNIEYIPTENKGYRANGERHPHSWSIVDIDELIGWILNN